LGVGDYVLGGHVPTHIATHISTARGVTLGITCCVGRVVRIGSISLTIGRHVGDCIGGFIV